MNAYLLTILGTVILSSFFTAILPDGKTTNTVKSIVKTVCLLVIISPVLGFLQTSETQEENSSAFFQENVIQTDEAFIKYYSELRVKNVETLLQQELLDRFSVQTEVRLDWANEEDAENGYNRVKILKINVNAFTQITEREKEDMRIYLAENYCSEVMIE